MATKRYRKVNKNKEITYEDLKNFSNDPNLSKYFLGGILGNNDTENTPQTTQVQGDSKNLLNNTSQTNGVGKAFSSVPIIGAFASLGTSIGGTLTQRDEYGIAQGSEGAQAVGNFIDPITVSRDLATEGKYGQAALSALIPGAGSIFGARLNKRKKQRLEEAKTNQRISETAQRELSQLEDTPTYGGVMRNGGTLNYGGQLHEGPNGGVPVDAMGNPNSMNPVALVEKGEVSYNTPDGGTYIYSDTLKHDKNKTFAKKAKDIQRRYKFRMKDGVINDPFAKKTYDAEMLQLQDNQEELKNFQNMQKESSEIKKNGGNLPLYFGPNRTNNWSMALPKQDSSPDFSINTKMLPFDQYAFGYNKFPNTFVGNKSTNNWSTKLPPLVKPADNTAAMDEFVRQVEMDHPSRLMPKTANISTTGVSAQLPKMKANNSNPPLVKPIADTAAMDEFANQVERDYSNSLLSLEQDVGKDVGRLANNSNPQLYQGMNWEQTGLAAAGPILGGITGLILNNKRKAPVNLKLSRMTPQQINLERRRAAARESAGVATSNLSRALKGVSPTAGSYMSNVVAGITDIDRNLSNQLGESYTQEELQNAQLRQQAEAANLDIDMQEQMYNSQLQNQFDTSKEAARNAYINQIGQGVTSALNQKFQSEQNANYLNMLNPDYVYYGTGKRLRYKPYIAPRRR